MSSPSSLRQRSPFTVPSVAEPDESSRLLSIDDLSQVDEDNNSSSSHGNDRSNQGTQRDLLFIKLQSAWRRIKTCLKDCWTSCWNNTQNMYTKNIVPCFASCWAGVLHLCTEVWCAIQTFCKSLFKSCCSNFCGHAFAVVACWKASRTAVADGSWSVSFGSFFSSAGGVFVAGAGWLSFLVTSVYVTGRFDEAQEERKKLSKKIDKQGEKIDKQGELRDLQFQILMMKDDPKRDMDVLKKNMSRVQKELAAMTSKEHESEGESDEGTSAEAAGDNMV